MATFDEKKLNAASAKVNKNTVDPAAKMALAPGKANKALGHIKKAVTNNKVGSTSSYSNYDTFKEAAFGGMDDYRGPRRETPNFNTGSPMSKQQINNRVASARMADMRQRRANESLGAGAAPGAQTPDSSGMGTGNPTQTPIDATTVGNKAQAHIKQQQRARAQINAPRSDTPTGPAGYDDQGNAKGGGTFNTMRFIPSQSPREERGGLGSYRPSSPQQKSRYEQELEARNRRVQYNQILSEAGAGPGKAINMRDALAAIGRLEEQRLKEAGQTLDFQAAQDRLSAADLISRRRTGTEMAGLESRERIAGEDRFSREAIAGAKLGQRQEEFDVTSGLAEDRFMEDLRKQGYTEEAAARAAQAEAEQFAAEQALERDKLASEERRKLLGSMDPSKGTDPRMLKAYQLQELERLGINLDELLGE